MIKNKRRKNGFVQKGKEKEPNKSEKN